MKKIILGLIVSAFVLMSCYYDDPSILDGRYYCLFNVYQNATIIDQECKICDLGDHDGSSVYYLKTNTTCTP